MFLHTRISPALLAIFLTGMSIMVSCSYKYLGPQEPEVFHASLCPGETASQAQSHAFSVVLNAMNSRNWHISSIDRVGHEIIAKAKGAEWSRVEVKVKPGGIIRIQRKIEEDLSRQNYKRMIESIDDLKKIYFKKYRCKSGSRNSR